METPESRMAILLLIAGLILIGIVLLLVGKSGRARRGSVPDRFKHTGPGETKPKGPRASGLD